MTSAPLDNASSTNQQLTTQALEAQANQLWLAGKIDEAATLFLELKKIAPENASLLRFIGLAALGRKDYANAIPHFQKLVHQVPAQAEAWFGLGVALFGGQQISAALDAFNQCLVLQPENVAALLYRGNLLEKKELPNQALSNYLKAVRLAKSGTGSASASHVNDFLQYANIVVSRALDQKIEEQLMPTYDQFGKEALARIRQCADIFIGKAEAVFAHPMWRPGLFYIPGLQPKMFFEREEFPQLKVLEENVAVIREELLTVMHGDEGFTPYINHAPGSQAAETWRDLNQSRSWSTYHFFRHGKKLDENCQRCPKTTALLESIDLVKIPGYGPEVMFSVLAPHTKIKAHYGPVNGRVIVHLPLIVPANCGAIRVGDQQREWKEGELLAFDDSFQHEAWNDSDETRVVMIFDVWNPQLTDAERAGYTALHVAAQAFENELTV